MKKILLIEDELPLVRIIKSSLEKHNIEVITADTIKKALACVETANVDAIWLDHYLPGKETGIDFVTKLKSNNSKWKNLPVFVVSNTASSHNVITYKQLGVSKYYVKALHQLDEIIKEIKPLIK